ncbi:DUF6071 family protein [Streptomyces sp. NPDC001828]|uniref:DUF6071 family protein n=1 Tax=Streptomyces sp. NPDC001828 TaxID=3364615 RepID=UPI00368B7E99
MYIYANGCSMTYGSELADDPSTGVCLDHEYRWRYSWPGQLRAMLDADGVYNDAMPSGSNDRIVRTTIDFVARWLQQGLSPRALMVTVGWTHPARREFHVAGEYRQVVPHHAYDIRKLDRLVTAYRKTAVSREEAEDRYVTQVASLHAFLEQHGVAHAFFNGILVPGVPEHLRNTCVQATLTGDVFLRPDPADPAMAQFVRRRPNAVNVQHPNETGHRLWATSMAGHLGAENAEHLESVGHASLDEAGLPVVGGVKAVRRHDRKGAERIGRFVRSRRTRSRTRRSDRSDPYIYP